MLQDGDVHGFVSIRLDVVQVLFRSVNKLLMDTATAEYLFCCDFFQEDTIFSELFAATLTVVEAALSASLQVNTPQFIRRKEESHLADCHDATGYPFTACADVQETFDLVGLLLMIRINYHHQLIMNKRRIPCLDDYLDRTNLLLWPRFKVSTLDARSPCILESILD